MVEDMGSMRVFQDMKIAPEMIPVPPGEFMMGSPQDEPEHGDEERPQHNVMINSPFAIGRYAITFDEFDAFVDSGYDYRPGDEGWGRGRRPVINVSYHDALSYCHWLTSETGHEYRLPSEAEWEYVARAGTNTPFWFGASMSADQANCDATFTYNGSVEGASQNRTIPVGSYKANGFGLFDVHGNVWEWVEDLDHANYIGAPDNGHAWLRDGDAANRVLRGGSWETRPGWSRSASRVWNFSDLRDDDAGFRVARSI